MATAFAAIAELEPSVKTPLSVWEPLTGVFLRFVDWFMEDPS